MAKLTREQVGNFLGIPITNHHESTWFVDPTRLMELLEDIHQEEEEIDMVFYLRKHINELLLKSTSPITQIYLNGKDYTLLRSSAEKNFGMNVNTINTIHGYEVRKSLISSYLKTVDNSYDLHTLEVMPRECFESKSSISCS